MGIRKRKGTQGSIDQNGNASKNSDAAPSDIVSNDTKSKKSKKKNRDSRSSACESCGRSSGNEDPKASGAAASPKALRAAKTFPQREQSAALSKKKKTAPPGCPEAPPKWYPRKRILIPSSMLGGAVLMFIAFYGFLPCFRERMSFEDCVDSTKLGSRLNLSVPSLVPSDFVPGAAFDNVLNGITSKMLSFKNDINDYLTQEQRPGITEEFRNRTCVHPVVMIPGFTGSRLEVWDGSECLKNNFRETIWGGTTMLKHLMKPACWFQHMKLNDTTGGDPIDPVTGKPIRVRPTEGFAASDYFIEGYYVWGPLIQNFADIGYDTKSMVLIGFDWRLAPLMNEKRDRWFTVLKHRIESIVAINGKPAVVPTHSFGSNVFFHFLQWVNAVDEFWAARYIHAHFDIGGPLLGVPKAVAAYFSGESGEAALLSPMLTQVLAFFHRAFDKRARKDLMRTFGSLGAMLPQGGEVVWPGSMLRIRDNDNKSLSINLTVTESLDLMQKAAKSETGVDVSAIEAQSVLDYPLPGIKNVYCVYGVGIPTESSFEYVKEGEEYALDLGHHEVIGFGDGDGTVTLQSLGYACHLWKKQKWHNPRKVRVVIREKDHDPKSFMESQGDLRGGVSSANHLDIMGNNQMIRDLLRVATGELLEDEIKSNLADISKDIDDKFGEEFFENGPTKSNSIR